MAVVMSLHILLMPTVIIAMMYGRVSGIREYLNSGASMYRKVSGIRKYLSSGIVSGRSCFFLFVAASFRAGGGGSSHLLRRCLSRWPCMCKWSSWQT